METFIEVWTHENCLVWASGVYMVGTKIFGLEDSVRIAKHTVSKMLFNYIHMNIYNKIVLHRSVYIVVLMELVLDALHAIANLAYIIVVLYMSVGY